MWSHEIYNAPRVSITLGDHFDGFITGQVKSGRFGSASEVIKAALRLLENTETKLETLRHMLVKGEQSGVADYNYDELMAELDSKNDK